MKAHFSSFDADRWKTPFARLAEDLPAEAPLAMPVQDFRARPDCRAVPSTSPSGIGGRRLILFAATAALTLLSVNKLLGVSASGGIDAVEAVQLALFVPLFAWIALSFCSAVAGFYALLSGRDETGLLAAEAPAGLRSRTAVLVPIYNEDVDAVFRRVRAMIRSLGATGAAVAFDIFILSDSTDQNIHAAERVAFERLRGKSAVRLYYRRRPVNTERKPGNIAEWVRRFGGAYAHMIVLDADSLMSGEAMIRLADAMERHPDVGLIQTVPTVAGSTTLFGRWQQFAARLYGPVSTAGLIWWSGAEGSFWGHNAIVRVRAFAESCGLPALTGPAPFGGHIMSHDIVEAALLRRNGWAVHMVTLPEGSYEEYPPTLIDYAIRDRRWCQGNLQHLQLLGSRGMHWISRLHLLMGASAYLTSPLWALLIGATLLQLGLLPKGGSITAPLAAMGGWLLPLTIVLLLGPKLLSLVWTLIDRNRMADYGGFARLLAGVAAEVPLALLLAPAVMVTQTGALIGLLCGRRGGWNAQRRDVDAIAPREAFSRYRVHVIIGLALLAVCVAAPSLILWMAPVILGLLLSPWTVMLTSRRDLGMWAQQAGIFATPEERAPLPLLIDGSSDTSNVVSLPFDQIGRRFYPEQADNWTAEPGVALMR